MSELKTKWPDIPEGWTARMLASDGYQNYPSRYERARADAAIERLLGAAKIASDYRDGMTTTRQCAQQLEAWLSAAGPIPGEQT